MVRFDIVYRDGSRRTDRKFALMCGSPCGPIKSITRSPVQ
jgi:hypothetical protein